MRKILKIRILKYEGSLNASAFGFHRFHIVFKPTDNSSQTV